jgi:hypothetical protein
MPKEITKVPNILVLRDCDGHLYLIGRETISAFRVRSQEHLEVIEKLVSGQNEEAIRLPHDLGLTVVGSFEARKDRFLRSSTELAVFASPHYGVVTLIPPPPS